MEERRDVHPLASKEEMQGMEGGYMDVSGDWTVLRDGNTSVYAADSKTLLCRVMRGAIEPALCQLAVECYMDAGKRISTNRGTAAGMQHRARSSNMSFERGAPANSGIVGYMDSLRHDQPCRLTAYSRAHFETYMRGLPFIHAMDECYRRAEPDCYAAQSAEANRSTFHIEGTAFSTVTVNLDYRTSIHRDSGDYDQGMGNLVVCSHGVRGGLLMFPRYRVAVELRTGDFLAMNVHEWHCNSPIEKADPGGYRLSFVCYLRARMHRCNEQIRRLQLMENQRTDAASLCARIFESVGEPFPEKRVIGTGPTGLEWYMLDGIRFRITYRNKRFLLDDKQTGKKVHNLWNALEYAIGRNHGGGCSHLVPLGSIGP